MFPGFISGVMWGIANAGFFVANANLGLAVGYPMVAIMPVVISSFWSVFYFREIQGRRNLSILSAALFINVLAVVFVALSFD
jgi:glucose uptake protein GlcU